MSRHRACARPAYHTKLPDTRSSPTSRTATRSPSGSSPRRIGPPACGWGPADIAGVIRRRL